MSGKKSGITRSHDVVVKEQPHTAAKLENCAPRVREQLRLELYGLSASIDLSPERLGTFQDCLRAPIHRWFRYPAGFSYKLVETLIEDNHLCAEHWLLV